MDPAKGWLPASRRINSDIILVDSAEEPCTVLYICCMPLRTWRFGMLSRRPLSRRPWVGYLGCLVCSMSTLGLVHILEHDNEVAGGQYEAPWLHGSITRPAMHTVVCHEKAGNRKATQNDIDDVGF